MKNDKPSLVVFFAQPPRCDRIETGRGSARARWRHADDTQV
jgi:hypothetical protein